MELLHQQLTERIIQGFFEVYNAMGYGFLEKVYERSLLGELKRSGLMCVNQAPIRVYYHTELVGVYFADMIVEDLIVLEIKATDVVVEEHELQLLNYLRATDKEIGLLLNFGKKPEVRRKVYSNDRKRVSGV